MLSSLKKDGKTGSKHTGHCKEIPGSHLSKCCKETGIKVDEQGETHNMIISNNSPDQTNNTFSEKTRTY